MTTIDVDQLRAHLDDYLAEATRGEVVVTHQGRPWVVLRAAGPDDDLASSPEFWEMIAQRRAEATLPGTKSVLTLTLDDGDWRGIDQRL